jgi:hypothetical protein
MRLNFVSVPAGACAGSMSNPMARSALLNNRCVLRVGANTVPISLIALSSDGFSLV